jgi:hypothetical protein
VQGPNIPRHHLSSAFPVLTTLETSIACHEFLEHRVELILCPVLEFNGIHEVDERLRKESVYKS